VRLGIGGGFPKCGHSGIFQLPQATPEALAIFSTADREKGIKIFQSVKIRLCPTNEFLQLPVKSAFKRLILKTPLYRHLLLTMSSTPLTDLTDQECEKGQLTQWPTIPYAISKAETILKASRENVKMKTPEGEVKMAVLGDSPGTEEYLQQSQRLPTNDIEEEIG